MPNACIREPGPVLATLLMIVPRTWLQFVILLSTYMSRRSKEKHFLRNRIGQHGGCLGGVMEGSQLLSWFNFYVGNLIAISKFITLGRS